MKTFKMAIQFLFCMGIASEAYALCNFCPDSSLLIPPYYSVTSNAKCVYTGSVATCSSIPLNDIDNKPVGATLNITSAGSQVFTSVKTCFAQKNPYSRCEISQSDLKSFLQSSLTGGLDSAGQCAYQDSNGDSLIFHCDAGARKAK